MPQNRSSAALALATLALASFACVTPASAAPRQQPSTTAGRVKTDGNQRTETLDLTYVKPSEVVAALATGSKAGEGGAPPLLPAGLSRVSPDDAAGTLTVRGSAASIDELREMTRLLDVAPRRVRLNVRILRGTFTGKAVEAVTEVAAFTSEVTNNRAGESTAIGDGHIFRARLTPHVNGDGSVSLAASLSQVTQTDGHPLPEPPRAVHARIAGGGVALLAAGEPSGGTTTRIPITGQAGTVQLPDGRKPGPLYLLEVTAAVLEPGRPLYARREQSPPGGARRQSVPILSDLPIIGRLFSERKPAVQ
ncbi:MAG TPA: secretin N-terminal domain-containing protein [Armatimonadaceae bacterium]|nr:secretin N-terminal domain-containing protein [Armatimonadaceae bacterium]